MAAERAVQRLFAGVAEGRMPDVVHQRQRFGQFRIQSQRCRHGARNLRHFERVRQAAAKVIGKSLGGQAGKHLRLPGQAAKGARVQNAGGVAREGCAIGVRRLRVDAAYEFAVGPPLAATPAGSGAGDSFLSAVRSTADSGLVIPQKGTLPRTEDPRDGISVPCITGPCTPRLLQKACAQQDGQSPGSREYHPAGFSMGWRVPQPATPAAAKRSRIDSRLRGGNHETMKGMALALAALAAVLIPGCEARHSLKEVFYLVGSNMSSNYWQTAVAGFKKAAAQYQVTAKVAGPDNYDPQAELTELKNAVAAKPAGILISVSDASVLTPEIDAAIDAGIPVITVDSDAAGSRRLYFIGTNNLDAGRLGGRRIIDKLGGKGNVVFFTIAGQPNTEERLKGFKDVFASRPGINIVDVVDIKGDTTVAFDRTQQLLALTGAKKIDAFVCLDSASGKLVADAVKRTGDTSRIVVAWDVNPDTLNGIKDGVIDSTDRAKALHDGIRRAQGAGRDLSRSARTAQQRLQHRRVRALPGVYRYRHVARG